jgi:hypothetical protein
MRGIDRELDQRIEAAERGEVERGFGLLLGEDERRGMVAAQFLKPGEDA